MLEARWFSLVDRLAANECQRRGLRLEHAEEFRSYARLHLAEQGERILDAHDGRCGIETYLVVVVARLLHDWQRAEWGTWRPSAAAVRLGTVAIALERKISRDGEPFERAAAALHVAFGERANLDELERIRRRLPARTRKREVQLESLDAFPAGGDGADEALNERERSAAIARLGPLIKRSLDELSARDRLLLTLVFREGLSVRAAARALALEHKLAGRRLAGAIDGLRKAVEKGGIDRYQVLLVLEAPLPGEEEWLQENRPSAWDNPPPGPSMGGAEP